MSELDMEKWSGRAKPGIPLFEGDEEIRNAFIRSKGIDWTASYIDPATWIAPSRTLVTATGLAYDRIMQGGSVLCTNLGITVREGGHRQAIRKSHEESERQHNHGLRPFSHREAAE